MRTLFPDPLPPEIEELLEWSRRSGEGTHDEVCEGVYHAVDQTGRTYRYNP